MSLKIKLALLFIVVLFWFFRLFSLGFDITNNDSQRWLNRSEGFLQAIKDGNFSDTSQKYHPGVTLMLINSVTRQIFYTYQYSFLSSKIDLNSPEYFPLTNLFSKLGLLVVIFILICYQTYLISKIWGDKVALLYFFILSIEPYFIGINRWFHLTSLEVGFAFSALLSLIYWDYSKIKKYFIFSAILFAFGVLTKVTTLVLGLILFYLLLKNYYISRNIFIFVSYFYIYLLTIFLFFPALWVSPVETSQYIFSSIFSAVGDDIRSQQLSSYVSYLYYLIILFYKLSPVTLLLFLFSFKEVKNYLKGPFIYIYLMILVYLISLSVSDQKIDRYSLVFFPAVILIVSYFISHFKTSYLKLVLSLYLLTSVIWFILFSPQYSSYYNPFLGGTNAALNLGIYENGGSYIYNAADFMNTFYPNSKVLVVDNYESFASFYKGTTERELSFETEYIISSLDIDRKNFNNFGCSNKIADFGPYDLKVVSIYKCNK